MSAKRRNKLEIYNDILNGINDEYANGEVKPTRIAHHAICLMINLQDILKN
ncbi:hypothetical protein [Nitrosopumilus sp.]|uniref:hypothetical protein n=1 Tax=Nitrosopumilus sp. TaxID=2024843 RepID=UPI00292D3E76|nr:hypothetical protein [Nitrosopumilus sp.]